MFFCRRNQRRPASRPQLRLSGCFRVGRLRSCLRTLLAAGCREGRRAGAAPKNVVFRASNKCVELSGEPSFVFMESAPSHGVLSGMNRIDSPYVIGLEKHAGIFLLAKELNVVLYC